MQAKKNKKISFMGFDTNYEDSTVCIVPFPLVGHSSGRKSTIKGPDEILKVSYNLEDFDTETKTNPSQLGIFTFEKQGIKKISKTIKKILKDGKFPIVLGGEHTLTHIILKTVREIEEEISLLIFDAHADLFDKYNGDPLSHACALYLSLPYIKKFVSIGVRNISPKELEIYQKIREMGTIIFVEEIIEEINEEKIKEAINSLSQKVWISFDLDFISPADMPSVTTPEPPGPSFRETLKILKNTIEILKSTKRKIIGFDIVEFSPQKLYYPEITVAKLIYKIIGYLISNTI